MDSSLWYAAVRYRSEYGIQRYANVPVAKIQYEYESKTGKTKRKSFKPDALDDFERGKWYIILTSDHSADSEAHAFYALIGRLAESEIELASNKKRIRWPEVPDEPDEPLTHEEESASDPQTIEVHREKIRRTGVKTDKQMAQRNDFDQFVASTQLIDDTEPTAEVDKLKARIKELEAQVSRGPDLTMETIISNVAAMREELKKVQQDVLSVREEVKCALGRSPTKPRGYVQDWLNRLPVQ
ncbi:hypothetical protein ONE63_009552 [Megalurothrips usitatus]|uniref:Uncharacterized protein n=1 Tax=Megalurothrips usitatus TaxID=439358 RepID=A0AAV7XP44_9NEOP|nr:hypothetical protein ONE63_009552 [Megalurothrips usitatus]